MSLDFQGVGRFSFRARPLPVPGDLRINWRLAVILLMLENSRAKRASLAKLHVLNEAVRSRTARATLESILDSDDHYLRGPRTMTILSLVRLPLRRDAYFHC